MVVREYRCLRSDIPFRRADVLVDVLRQHVERHVAAEHYRVVERLEIVARPERSLRALALPVDLAVPDLVATRLSRPRAVAIDFTGHLDRIRSVALDEEVDPLLSRPSLRVNASVDHQTAGAEGDRLQVTKLADRIVFVGPELIGQLLRV